MPEFRAFPSIPGEDPAPVLPGGFGDVAGTIMEVVEREHIDMVVISTHGISGWHPLVFDSIAGMLVGKQRTGDPLLNAAFVADQPLEMSNSEQTPVLG